MDRAADKALQGAEQVLVAPVFVGGAEGADGAAGVGSRCAGGGWIDEAVEDAVAARGSGEGEAECGFEEDADEFCVKGVAWWRLRSRARALSSLAAYWM